MVLTLFVLSAEARPRKLGQFESELTACDTEGLCAIIATFYQLSEMQALEACEFHANYERKANATQEKRVVFSCALTKRPR